MKTFTVTVTRGKGHEFNRKLTVRAVDKRDALFLAIGHVRHELGSNVALFAEAVETQLSLRKQVENALTDELREPKYRDRGPLAGHCYVASEAYFHLTGGYARWAPKQMVHEGDSHWFLVDRQHGFVVDITAGQFKTVPDYSQAKGRGFQTKAPSKRAQVVIDRVRANAR